MALIVSNTVILLFLYICFGYLMRKIGILDDTGTKALTGVFMLTSLPAIILNGALNQVFDPELLTNILIAFFSFSIVYIVLAIIGLIVAKLFKLPKAKVGVYAFCMSFSQIGLMGLPVVGAIWGGIGVFYGIVMTLAYFILLPTMGVWLTLKSVETEDNNSQAYEFKPTIALVVSIIGLVYYFSQEHLPEVLINLIRPAVIDGVGGGPIGAFIGGVAATGTPLSMFLIGSFLGRGKANDILKEPDILVLTIIKLVAAPLLVLYVLQIFIEDSTLLGVLVILCSMPTAALSAVYAEKYKADAAYASRAVLVTTIFSLITIPLIALLL